MPPGPWHYPEDEISDAPLRLLAAEITREKIYERLHDELPYADDGRDHLLAGAAEGACASSRPSSSSATARRRIVLGKGGRMIKQLSMEARKELAEILEKPVHLFLFVKVRESWGDDPERYREHGPDFPQGLSASRDTARNSPSQLSGTSQTPKLAVRSHSQRTSHGRRDEGWDWRCAHASPIDLTNT